MASTPKLPSVIGRHRQRNEEGAALVEFALVVPLLSILAFGALEFGFLFSHGMDLKTANRAGARLGATTGAPVIHDFDILQTIRNSRGAIPLENIEKVIVFNASSGSGDVPPACLNTPFGSPGHKCNVYDNADLQASSVAGITHHEHGWKAADRETGMDLGIYIESRRSSITGLFGSGFPVRDRVVLRIEPAAAPDATFTLPTMPPPPTTTTTTTPPPTTTTIAPPTTTTTAPAPTTSTTQAPRPSTTRPRVTTTTRPRPTTTRPATTTTWPSYDG